MIAAAVLVFFRRLWPAIPWLALGMVALATIPAFQSSRYFIEENPSGAAVMASFGWFWTLFTTMLAFGILVWSLRAAGARFFPAPCVAIGLLYVAAFHAFFPPWLLTGDSLWHPWVLLVLSPACLFPGFAMVALGVFLWRRHGLLGPAWLGEREANY